MKVCVIIPVYNNCKTVGEVVRRTRRIMEPDVFVISDGSTDGSNTQAEKAGAKVFHLPENRGKGFAIRHGLTIAEERGYTHAIIIDADGQHLPEELPRFLDRVWAYPARLWIGVRKMEEAGSPKWNQRGRSIANFWTTLNGWQRCFDAQSGYRVYPIRETLDLQCKEPGFQFEMEVLVRGSWAGIPLGHMQIDVVYPREGRVTHFNMKSDNWKFSVLSFKLFWGMLFRLPLLIWRRLLAL